MRCVGTPASHRTRARMASVDDLPLPAHEWTVMHAAGSAVATIFWYASSRPREGTSSFEDICRRGVVCASVIMARCRLRCLMCTPQPQAEL